VRTRQQLPAKAILKSRGLTNQEVGRLTGFHYVGVSRFLNGVEAPTVRFRAALTQLTGEPEDVLFGEDPVTARIAELIAAAPPLTDEQKSRLRALLGSVRVAATP
jgi:transcriptional regulator with XRE-family HTH domain